MNPKRPTTSLHPKLTPLQYRVTQEGGTEPPFTGEFYDNHETGMYHCIVCKAPLFSSKHKYDSGSGWPSFWQGVGSNHLTLLDDVSHGRQRTEVRCAKCGAHLGHVFPDGPKPTGERYCINSAALGFNKD